MIFISEIARIFTVLTLCNALCCCFQIYLQCVRLPPATVWLLPNSIGYNVKVMLLLRNKQSLFMITVGTLL